MHNALNPASALKQQSTDLVVAAALLELDLEAAQPLSRPLHPPTSSNVRGKELTATKRANRSNLDEIAASLGVSRSTMSRILEEPPLHGGGNRADHKDEVDRHHGTGRRRGGAGSGTRGNLRRQSARRAYIAAAKS